MWDKVTNISEQLNEVAKEWNFGDFQKKDEPGVGFETKTYWSKAVGPDETAPAWIKELNLEYEENEFAEPALDPDGVWAYAYTIQVNVQVAHANPELRGDDRDDVVAHIKVWKTETWCVFEVIEVDDHDEDQDIDEMLGVGSAAWCEYHDC